VKTERKIDRKSVSLVLVSLLIGIIIGASFVYAQSASQILTISQGAYPGAPSYTVYSVSGTTYAKDQNGYNEFSGSNASLIIQSVFDELASQGGSIYFAEGNYILNDDSTYGLHLDLRGGKGDIKLIGDLGAVIDGSTMTGETLLSIYGGHNIEVSGLTFYGGNNPDLFRAIYVGLYESTSNLNIHDCFFNDLVIADDTYFYLSYGIQILRGEHISINNNHFDYVALGITIEGSAPCQNIGVTNNVFSQITDVGIVLESSGSGTSPIRNIVISNNNIEVLPKWTPTPPYEHNPAGINLNLDRDDGCGWVSITGNTIYGNSSDNVLGAVGIGVQGGENVIVSGNSIYYCYNNYTGNYGAIKISTGGGDPTIKTVVANNVIAYATNGIIESGTGTDYNIIIGNIVSNCTLIPILTSGTNTKCNLNYNGTSWIS
jgi:hypothetical protein